jgi:hypothetical protein
LNWWKTMNTRIEQHWIGLNWIEWKKRKREREFWFGCILAKFRREKGRRHLKDGWNVRLPLFCGPACNPHTKKLFSFSFLNIYAWIVLDTYRFTFNLCKTYFPFLVLSFLLLILAIFFFVL